MELVVLALLVVAGVWWMRGDSDERQIERRMNALVELLEKDRDTAPMLLANRSRQVRDFFTAEATLSMAPLFRPSLSYADIAPMTFYVHRNAEDVRVTVRDRVVEVAPDRQSAVLRCTVDGRVALAGETVRLLHEFRIDWQKEDDAWMIARVELVQAIRAPGMD
jgi:hypothetical protein